MRLADKVGLVTAAGSGMGRAGAIRFAREGAAVAIVDRDSHSAQSTADEIAAFGGSALPIIGDLSDRAFAGEIVQRAVDHFGKLEFLWNHVGIPGPSQFEELDLSLYDEMRELNIDSGICTTIAAIPHLKKAGGSILFTASTSALVGSPMSPLYSMSKAGMIGLVKGLARRLAPDKIRVNALAPSAVDTPMLDTFFARPDDPRKLTKEDARESIKRNAALFLLSDEASFITGITLVVDGGLTA